MLDPAWPIDTKCKADKSRHTLTLLSNHSKFPTVPHATFIRQLIYTFSSSTSFFHFFFSFYPPSILLFFHITLLILLFPNPHPYFFSHLFLTLGRSISRVRANIRLLFDQDNLFPFCLPKLDKTYHLLHLLHLTSFDPAVPLHPLRRFTTLLAVPWFSNDIKIKLHFG